MVRVVICSFIEFFIFIGTAQNQQFRGHNSIRRHPVKKVKR